MKIINYVFLLCFFLTAFTGCFPDNVKEEMQNSMKTMLIEVNEQHFKTAISLIELHKIRFGSYPESIDSIKYTGIMDKGIQAYVKYEKIEDGYTLDLINVGPMGIKNIDYPPEFWAGLGLKSSNLKTKVNSKDSVK